MPLRRLPLIIHDKEGITREKRKMTYSAAKHNCE
jgi:hypothetical protein